MEEKAWRRYVWHKQTKKQLSSELALDKKKITKLLDDCELKRKRHDPRPVVAIMDATYFSRRDGVLAARDPNKKENLHVHEIISETKGEYQEARNALEEAGYVLQAVVLDGRRGIPSVFKDIPIQICHFHQWSIVRRKLTLKPKLEAHQALLSAGRKISKADRKEMKKLLDVFAKLYREELNEKTYTIGSKRWRYAHSKLRSAYLSLTRNLPHLYVYQDYPELNIPNTTNSLDGTFNALKSHLNIHRGLRKDRRFKLVKSYLKL